MKQDQLVEHLERALDAVLTARLMVDGATPPLPDVALDEALRCNPEFQKARRGFGGALEKLLDLVGKDQKAIVFNLEGAVNEMIAVGAGVGWSLALKASGEDSGGQFAGKLSGESDQ